jgi:hypothetical protein
VGGLARLAACAVSLALLAAAGGALAASSCAALVLLPWIALAGFPRLRADARPVRSVAGDLALVLPIAAVALRVDGVDDAGARSRVLVGIAAVALLALGASAASGGPRARAWHGGAWLVACLVAPLAGAVETWGGGALPRYAALSPLAWVHAQSRAGAAAPEIPWLALATCAALVVVAYAARGMERASTLAATARAPAEERAP